jgi:hypothetical protein
MRPWRLALAADHPVTVAAKHVRLELPNVKADLQRELARLVVDCTAYGQEVYWVQGVSMTDPGHWGHRFPAPHGKAVVLPPPCCSGGDRISHGDQRLAAWSVIRRLLTGHAVTPEDLRSGGAASWFVYRLQPGATWLAAGWCHPSASGDPVFIPHDVEKRGVLTRIDPEPNSQVSDPFPPPPQVTDSAGSASQGGDTGSNPVGTTKLTSANALSP